MNDKLPSAEKILEQAYRVYSFEELKDLPDDALVNLTLLLEEKIIEHGTFIPWAELRTIRVRATKYPSECSEYRRPSKPPLPKKASFLEQRLHVEFEPESLKRQITHDEWRRQVWMENNANIVTRKDIEEAMLAVSTSEELEALSTIERQNFASVVSRRLRKAGTPPTLDELQGLKELALEHLWCRSLNELSHPTKPASNRRLAPKENRRRSLEEAVDYLTQLAAIAMRNQ